MISNNPEASLLMLKAVVGFLVASASAAATNAANLQSVVPPVLVEYGAWGIFSLCLIYAVVHLWRANAKLQEKHEAAMERQIVRLQEKLDEIEEKRQG